MGDGRTARYPGNFALRTRMRQETLLDRDAALKPESSADALVNGADVRSIVRDLMDRNGPSGVLGA
jgi:hypothetical protein